MLRIIRHPALWILCSGLGANGLAQADAVTVNITSNVIAAPCVIDGAGSLDIKLDDIVVSKLQKSGDTGPFKSFDLKLKDCPAATTKVTASYTGTASPLSANSFINTGTASQLVLYLQDSASKEIAPNTTRQVDVNSTSKTAVFSQKVQIYAKGLATAGTVIGNIVVSFTYQ
ncbi:putative fimbrial protein SthD [Serratia quinivorans]|jgi:minor fimbrial subunit|uniref:fimbrial protein n=1 Tax=Serratia quinivorans TaxID=137545 RepID=UPI000D96FED7|nr:fimbrial protein [Serratia quinivorans]CAI0798856.1 putative fimbrial protein SthD [Serratia quinivorans]SPZ66464.1 putative fimbrial protein SthD [Serratia quinivorans]VEI71080.1 putative fimbrial protein SthD [Serratia quinivorans]